MSRSFSELCNRLPSRLQQYVAQELSNLSIPRTQGTEVNGRTGSTRSAWASTGDVDGPILCPWRTKPRLLNATLSIH